MLAVVAAVFGLAIGMATASAAVTDGTVVESSQTVTIEVVVVESGSGDPVGEVGVFVSWGTGSGLYETRPNGRVLVDVPRGANVTITVASSRYSRDSPYVIESAAGSQEVVVPVSPIGNAPPTAEDVTVSTAAGTAVSGTFAATDPDGDPLAYAIVQRPTHGTVTVTGDEFTYRPPAGFTGTAGFQYRVTDGNGGSDTATVTADVSESSGAGVSRIAFDYRNRGPVPSLSVNGERRIAGFPSLDGATVGGATVTVRQRSATAGTVVVRGDITSFSVGGVEHWIDNVTLSTGATTRTVRFSALRPARSGYDVGATFRSVPTGVRMRVRPYVYDDGSTYGGGLARVSNGKYWLGQTNLRVLLDSVGSGAPTIDASSLQIVPYPVPVGVDPEISVQIDGAESASVLVDPAGTGKRVEVPMENIAGDLWSASLDDAAVLNGLDAGAEVDLTIRARNDAGTATLERFYGGSPPDEVPSTTDLDLDYYLFERIRNAAVVVGELADEPVPRSAVPDAAGRRRWRVARELYVNNYYGSGKGSMGAVGFDLELFTNDGDLYRVDGTRSTYESGNTHLRFANDFRAVAESEIAFERFDFWVASHTGEQLGRAFFCPRLPEKGLRARLDFYGWGCDKSGSGARTVYVTASGLVGDEGHLNHVWLHEFGHDRGLGDLYEHDASIITLMGSGTAGTRIGTLSRLGLNNGSWGPGVKWLDANSVSVTDVPPGGRTVEVPRLGTVDLGDEVPVIEGKKTDHTFDTESTFVPEYRPPLRAETSVLWLYRAAPGIYGTVRERIGSLTNVGESLRYPLGIRSSAYVRFELTGKTDDEATVSVESTTPRPNTYTVVMQDRARTGPDRIIAAGNRTDAPDLDLIAIDDRGRRVGVTADGEYVTEIPGARASGDRSGLEWISVPRTADVRFRVRSEITAASLATGDVARENVTLTYRTAVTRTGKNPRIVRQNGSYAVADAATGVATNRTVEPGGSAPALDARVVAVAGATPRTAQSGESVTLDASSSFALDGSIERYAWDLDGDGRTEATGRRARASFAAAGTHTVSLVVTSSAGTTDTANVSISVAATDDPDEGDDHNTTAEDGTGFGVVAVLAALTLAAARLRRRSRDRGE